MAEEQVETNEVEGGLPSEEVPTSMKELPGGANVESFLKVDAKATIKDESGTVVGYRTGSVYYKFGKDLEEAREVFTDPVVHTQFRAQTKIRLQSLIRSHMVAGKDLTELASNWKPGVQYESAPVDPEVAAENYFNGLTDDAQDAFLKKLMARQV